jgi:hypothetical protein
MGIRLYGLLGSLRDQTLNLKVQVGPPASDCPNSITLFENPRHFFRTSELANSTSTSFAASVNDSAWTT